MNRQRRFLVVFSLVVLAFVAVFVAQRTRAPERLLVVETAAPTKAETSTPGPSKTKGPTRTATVRPTNTSTPTFVATNTHTPTSPTFTPVPTVTPGGLVDPHLDAPLCTDLHDNSLFHTLWDGARDCHYDHEHGQMDFNAAAEFFGVDLQQFTGQEISYPWQTIGPTGCLENDCKHEGYKWTFQTSNEDPCVAGEIGPNGTDGFAVEFHARGNGHEHLTRVHSSFIAVTVCNPQGQRGVLVTGGWQDYGQRVSSYQSEDILALSGQPDPAYRGLLSPYLSLDCYDDTGNQADDCGTKFIHSGATWVSRPQAREMIDCCHKVAQLLFRSRDPHQWVNGSSRFLLDAQTFRWVCGVETYNPVGCRGNNTTVRIHQVFGDVPEAWDSLDGAVDGLVTWQGYTDRWGNVVEGCEQAGLDCVPIYLQNVPVGGFSSTFDNEVPASSPEALPERDIYFCSSLPCTEGDFGAVSSGWIGAEN